MMSETFNEKGLSVQLFFNQDEQDQNTTISLQINNVAESSSQNSQPIEERWKLTQSTGPLRTQSFLSIREPNLQFPVVEIIDPIKPSLSKWKSTRSFTSQRSQSLDIPLPRSTSIRDDQSILSRLKSSRSLAKPRSKSADTPVPHKLPSALPTVELETVSVDPIKPSLSKWNSTRTFASQRSQSVDTQLPRSVSVRDDQSILSRLKSSRSLAKPRSKSADTPVHKLPSALPTISESELETINLDKSAPKNLPRFKSTRTFVAKQRSKSADTPIPRWKSAAALRAENGEFRPPMNPTLSCPNLRKDKSEDVSTPVIELIKFTVTGFDRVKNVFRPKSFRTYKIDIVWKEMSWTIFRRFKQVQKLRSDLTTTIPPYTLPYQVHDMNEQYFVEIINVTLQGCAINIDQIFSNDKCKKSFLEFISPRQMGDIRGENFNFDKIDQHLTERQEIIKLWFNLYLKK